MGVGKSIEQRLEGLVEGFFARVFRSGLQPVEVGRRILREMGDNKTVSVNKVYAPNEFRIFLAPDDHGRFSKMSEGLEKEFSELIIDQAKQNRWNLMGMPRVIFEEVEKLGRGQFKIESSLSSDPSREPSSPKVSTRAPDAGDPSATRAIVLDDLDKGKGGERASLVVLGASNEDIERISITQAPVSIGRLSGNDVVLSDPNVSRRHAELRRDGGRWLLVDLGSTNGTQVNDKLAGEHEIEDGDVITFGGSKLRFEAGGG